MTLSNNRPNLYDFYASPLGKKIITGVTGVGLTLFVVIHLMGNLMLFVSVEAYNQLAYVLNSLGVLLYTIEFFLLGLIVFHVAIAVSIQIKKQQARPQNYAKLKSIGKPSKQSISSRTMIFTGMILLIFLVFHLLTFKFGAYYSIVVKGTAMRDLARLVIEKFQNPVYTFSYVGVMIFLGFHLRHGIWSASQSLGAINVRFSSIIYFLALIFAVLIAFGFLLLPLAIYLGFI